MSASVAELLAGRSDAERHAILADLPPEAVAGLPFNWPFWARPDQLPPAGAWRTWLLLGGRGSGKTRSAAEWVRAEVEGGRRRSIGILGPTADTLRRDAVQGSSGLLAVSPPWMKAEHEPSQRRVVWPNGAVGYLMSSEEPDRIRGANLDGAWCDEVTSWSNPAECWSNLQLALRISGPGGAAPAAVVSTTPKRHALLREIIADPATVVTRSRTTDNAANLDPATLRYLAQRYGGTTLGRQELDAELLDDVDGALWSRALLDRGRVAKAPDLRRVVVAIDPAGSSGAGSDETGIVVAGATAGSAADQHAYVLADYSGRYTPQGWARRALDAFDLHQADRIVAERNFGGEMVEATIRNASWRAPVRMVHASRGKLVRAEPIAALYEQGRVHHVGVLPALEDQMCGWNPAEGGKSPDRVDALVWALTELINTASPLRATPLRI